MIVRGYLRDSVCFSNSLWSGVRGLVGAGSAEPELQPTGKGAIDQEHHVHAGIPVLASDLDESEHEAAMLHALRSAEAFEAGVQFGLGKTLGALRGRGGPPSLCQHRPGRGRQGSVQQPELGARRFLLQARVEVQGSPRQADEILCQSRSMRG